MEMTDLDLSTLGELNEKVRNLFPSLVQALEDEDDKASLNISVSLTRMKGSDSAIVVKYAVKPVYPKRAQALLCRADLTGNLKTEASPLKQGSLL